jgi:hypothetical protein
MKPIVRYVVYSDVDDPSVITLDDVLGNGVGSLKEARRQKKAQLPHEVCKIYKSIIEVSTAEISTARAAV